MGAVADLDEASAGDWSLVMEWAWVLQSAWRWQWCRRRRRRSAACRRLDCDHHWRPCLEEAYCRVGSLRRLIGIKPEVIQCAKANRVSVLILRKGFGVPGDRSSWSE